MKKTTWLLPLLLLALITISGCAAEVVEPEEIEIYGFDDLQGPEVVTVENDHLILHFYPFTTQIMLEDKKTGAQWRSNPEDAVNDPKADANISQLLQSQLSLTYANKAGVENTLTNFQFSVSKGLYEYEKTANGFDIRYTIGNIDRVYFIPVAVPKSRMMELYELLEKKEQRQIDEYYREYNINALRATDNKDQLLSFYPGIADEPYYVLRDSIQPYLKVKIEAMFEAIGYTEEDYLADMEYIKDQKALDIPLFNVTLRYELDGADLKVSIPYDEVRYKTEYPVTSLRILPYFASAGLEDEGYLFVPDGSGSVINFNNGRQNMDPFVSTMYGWDTAMYREFLVNENRSQIPVFGIYKNQQTLMCIIEDGASYAAVEADVSNRRTSYNNVMPRFNIVRGATMDISAKSNKTVMMYQKELPAGENLSLRYVLCEEEGYVGMAVKYRDYLMKTQGLKKMTETVLPVAVEITGAVNKNQIVAGLPFDLPLKLTTYKEAEAIVNDLDSKGWQNVSYKLNGWFNGSVQHSVPSKINLIGELGGKKDLQSFIDAIKQNGDTPYLEADFVLMKDTNPFDGFSLYNDAARYINRERVIVYPFSISVFFEKDWAKMSYLASPAYTMELIDGFVKKMAQYGTTNLSFRNIGYSLAGDDNEKNFVSRETAMKMQTAKLQELQASGSKTMVKLGNNYSLFAADFITDATLPSYTPTIVNYSVPFYEIVLHGLVPFAGGAINLAEDYSGNILRAVESGAGLYFSFVHESAMVLQNSLYYEYYANQYSVWAEDADRVYRQLSDEFAVYANQFIINHEILSEHCTRTTYEDGSTITVNHGVVPVTVDGVAIEARSYKIAKGGNGA